MAFNSNSDLPTWEDATMTMLRTFGSLNASIGSLRYGVLEVRHGPGSDALGGSQRYLSAHSESVRFSGGFMPLRARLIARLSFAASFSLVIVITESRSFPIFPFPDALLVFSRIVLIPRQRFHDLEDLLANDRLGLCC